MITVAELDANLWASCGPTACAALLSRPLADIRHAFPNQRKGRTWTNFDQMLAALRTLGATGHAWKRAAPDASARWPSFGLVLVQFDGAWSSLPLSHPAQLAHTHWIAAKDTARGPFVFDVNSVDGLVSCEGPGWDPREVWEHVMAPTIAESYGTKRDGTSRATGMWWTRAGIEVAP